MSVSNTYSNRENNQNIDRNSNFDDGTKKKFFQIKHAPQLFFIALMGLVYISNSHFAEKNIRKINTLTKEIEDIRADYITLKADHMFASKQSEVAKRVQNMGLKESKQPPIVIKLNSEN